MVRRGRFRVWHSARMDKHFQEFLSRINIISEKPVPFTDATEITAECDLFDKVFLGSKQEAPLYMLIVTTTEVWKGLPSTGFTCGEYHYSWAAQRYEENAPSILKLKL